MYVGIRLSEYGRQRYEGFDFFLEVIGQKLISSCSKQHRQIRAFKHIGIASIFWQFCFADGNFPR